MSKLKSCKSCGAEIAVNAKTCPSCGAKNGKPLFKRAWFWALAAIILIAGIGGAAGSGDTQASSDVVDVPAASDSSVTSEFEGDCGIAAEAEMGDSIIGYPELTISITNTTEKEIAAIRFYAVQLDVYGSEITSWSSQNRLYTDTAIQAGESTTITYQFIEESVKTVELYVYSVYFSDGTEWGNREATKSSILENGAAIAVAGTS